MKRASFLLALLWLATAHALGAQLPATTGLDSARSSLLAALRSARDANRLVRVHLAGGATLTGRVGEVSGSLTRVAAQPLDLARLDSLEVRFTRPDPLREGAAIGGVAGLALGALGATFAAGLSEGGYSNRAAITTVAIAGGVGVLFGTMVDAGIEGNPLWRTVWRRSGAAPEPGR